MSRQEWNYYNHALVSSLAAHEQIDSSIFNNKDIWRGWPGRPLLARWTEAFDCKTETEFWWVIKDTPFNIAELKAKRRYEINKGNKNFECKIIDPDEYLNEVFNVWSLALSGYNDNYRPDIQKDEFLSWIKSITREKFIGAFYREDNSLAGIAIISNGYPQRYFSALKTIPSMERLGVNAALVHFILMTNEEFLQNGGYICDGARSIYHQTNFQDYLEKYFGFRKAYCVLRVCYPTIVRIGISILFPLKDLLERFDKNPKIHQINGVLKIEEISRKCIKQIQ